MTGIGNDQICSTPAASTPWIRTSDWLVAIALASIILAHALIYAYHTPLGIPPDERAHITYIADIQSGEHLIPDYTDSRIGGIKENYLTHPPLYYTSLGLLGRATGWNPLDDFHNYRVVSALLVALGLLVWVINARLLGISLGWIIPIALTVNVVPMFPYLAGSINNDNLAYLSAAVAVLGLVNTGRLPRASWYVGTLGLAMALLTKATVGVFLVLVFSIWLLRVATTESRSILFNKHFALSLVLLALSVGAYYLATYAVYGTFFPAPGGLYAVAPPQDPLSFMAFMQEFLWLLKHYLAAVMSGASTFPIHGYLRDLFFLALLLPLLGWIASFPSRPRTDRNLIGDSIFIASLATLGIHALVVWKGYLTTGLISGTQPRYYFYLLPAVFIAGFMNYRHSRVTHGLLILFAGATSILLITVPPKVFKQESIRHAPPLSLAFRGGAVPPHQLHRVGLATGNAGFVDTLRARNDVLQISGWAIDAQTREPAQRVDVYYNGHRIASVAPSLNRLDVAHALDEPSTFGSGFRLNIERMPDGVSPCDFQIASVQSQGLPIALKTPSCSSNAHNE